MNSYEWKGGEFVEVPDPTYNPDIGDVEECIRTAGYRTEVSSRLVDNFGADITVYSTDKEGIPRFYIDVMGQNSGIATLVAHDFPQLARTLKEIQPLIALVGLDQYAGSQIEV